MASRKWSDFGAHVERLEDQAKQSSNDVRYGQYVQYVNCFISKFGNERSYMVGSTGDRTKLASSKDDGDADILLVSGKLQIPAKNLEFKVDNPCYVWIRADDDSKQLGLELVEDKYLSATSLRKIKPELFTFIRAFHSHVTADFDRIGESGEKDTIITVPSKVGLASTKYRNLKVHGFKARTKRQKSFTRSEEMKRHLTERWTDVKIHEHDVKMVQRVLKMLMVARRPRNETDDHGQIAFFAQAFEDALSRPKLEISPPNTNDLEPHCSSKDTNTELEAEEINSDTLTLENDLDGDIVDDDNGRHGIVDDEHGGHGIVDDDNGGHGIVDDDNGGHGMRATYKEKHHRDFVPAFNVIGELDYMQQWKRRVEKVGWQEARITEIYATEVFVVSRVAPIHPSILKDFCLSFNLAERKLVQGMSVVQRKVFLIMKAFLKGSFERKHNEEKRKLKLKTYHVKTLLLWLYESCDIVNEETDVEMVYNVLQIALGSLREKLIERKLLHYFVPSNLFIEFENEDFRILIECVDIVQHNTIGCLNYYFSMNDGKPVDILFTPEETRCLQDMAADGGRSKHVDKLEDAMIDLQKGCNDSTRDEEGRAPIKEAIMETMRLYLNDEKHINFEIFKLINGIVVGNQTEINRLSQDEVIKKISGVIGFIEILASVDSDVKRFVSRFGGIEEVKRTLKGAYSGKAVDFGVDLGDQIIETVDRYLSCSDEEEDAIADELKYKLLGYFSAK